MSDGNNVMSIMLTYNINDSSGISNYEDFTYSIAAIMISLKSDNGLDKVLNALKNSRSKEKTTSVIINNVVYNFSSVVSSAVDLTKLSIYPQ